MGVHSIGGKSQKPGNQRNYTSSREVKLETGGEIVGSTTRTVPDTSVLGVSAKDSLLVRIAKSLLSQLRWFLGISLVGLLLLWLFQKIVSGVSETPLRSPWKSLGLSVAVLIIAPFAFIVAGMIAMVIGGFSALPVLLVPGAVYVVLLTLAAPAIAVLIGDFVLRYLMGSDEPAGWKALLLGAAILAVIGLIPILSVVATILTILYGFGAWTLYLYRSYSGLRTAQ
jgi:hypothetical protein